MDPRPYHYEYRRPRFNNPTYQSLNLYSSLYHKDIKDRYQAITNNSSDYPPYNNSYRETCYKQQQKNNRSRDYIEKHTPSIIQKKQPFKTNMSNSVMINSVNPELDRPYSNRSNKSNEQIIKQERPSILASYGRNSMMDQKNSMLQQKQTYLKERTLQHKIRSNSGAYDRLNQFSIFQKQQKPYSIVGNYPQSTSTELKKYPKLTLENKLIEEGRYYPTY